MKDAPVAPALTPATDWDWAPVPTTGQSEGMAEVPSLEDIEHGPPELSSSRAIQLADRAMIRAFSPTETARYCDEQDVQIRDLPKLTADDGRVIHRWLVRGTLELIDVSGNEQRNKWKCAIGHWDGTFVLLALELHGADNRGFPTRSEMKNCINRIASGRLEEAVKRGGGRDQLQPVIDEFPYTRAAYEAQNRIRELDVGRPKNFSAGMTPDGGLWSNHEVESSR